MQVLERFSGRRIWLVALALGAIAAGTSLLLAVRNGDATTSGQAEQAPAATPVSAATVEQRDVALWDEFSGRLEAVERVEVGRLQLVDNQVDARSGTVRVRAVFANPRGDLLPGQFARLSMGQGKREPALLVSERAIGTDQNKKFVMVVGPDDKAEYREVMLGPEVEGLRVVASGLSAGERIVVNGLQRVRPGAPLAAQLVGMDGKTVAAPKSTSDVVQR